MADAHCGGFTIPRWLAEGESPPAPPPGPTEEEQRRMHAFWVAYGRLCHEHGCIATDVGEDPRIEVADEARIGSELEGLRQEAWT